LNKSIFNDVPIQIPLRGVVAEFSMFSFFVTFSECGVQFPGARPMEDRLEKEKSQPFYCRIAFWLKVLWFVTAAICFVVFIVMIGRVNQEFWRRCQGTSDMALLISALALLSIALILQFILTIDWQSCAGKKVLFFAIVFVATAVFAVLAIICATTYGKTRGDEFVGLLCGDGYIMIQTCKQTKDQKQKDDRNEAWVKLLREGKVKDRSHAEGYWNNRTKWMRLGVLITTIIFLVFDLIWLGMFMFCGGLKSHRPSASSQPAEK
jgi:hypothetical protein